MHESSNIWVFDDSGVLAFPRIALECIAPGLPRASEHYDGLERGWDTPDVKLNIVFADGRAYRFRDVGKKHPTQDSDGRHSILGAGPLEFRCVEPFRLWTASFQGTAVETSSSALMVGNYGGPLVDVQMHLEATMAVPPWSMGSLSTEGATAYAAWEAAKERIGDSSIENGFRYEQLFRASGALQIRNDEYRFNGSGLRIRRQGIRKLTGFSGHCWQSALFPSGKAFGFRSYPARPDGVPSFDEGWIFTGDGGLIPARVLKAPWLRRLEPKGEDVSVLLESASGAATIEGETVVSSFEVTSSNIVRPNLPNFPVLYQGGVRFRWDGEETYGMSERSTRRDLIEAP
jgi:hypothetical protein